MRRLDVIALIAVVVVAVLGKMAGYGGDAPDATRRPPIHIVQPAPRHQGPQTPLPRRSVSDPAFVVQVGPAAPSTGTAFSIDGSGRWLTARHVIEGCSRVVIRTGKRKGVRVRRIAPPPNADVAVLWTDGGTPPLAISNDGLATGQNGFHFGFPGGEPGDVYGRVIGRRTMRVSGQYRTNEPVIAWTQLRRVPDRGPNLAGISGGPVLDEAGRVIGIVVAGAPRRGRTYSAAPASVAGALHNANLAIRAGGGARQSLSARDFPAHGNRLRARLTVAKVFCMVGRNSRRRPLI